MKRRVLQVQYITEEQLIRLMYVAQGIRMSRNNFFIIMEDIDWYIVLYVLLEQDIIPHRKRVPYAAFTRWIRANISVYQEWPNARHLASLGRRLVDTHYPWESKKAPRHVVKKWEEFYHLFTRLVVQTIFENDCPQG